MYDELTRILMRSFQVDPESIAPEVSLEELGMDSLDVVELGLMIEQELGVSVDDDALADAGSVSGIVDLVSGRLDAVA